MSNQINSVVIAVTCFDSGSNRIYLEEISREWGLLAKKVTAYIVTNNPHRPEIKSFAQGNHDFTVKIVHPTLIGHPFLLSWVHREVFLEVFHSDPDVRHFLYLEDDVLFTKTNFEYFQVSSLVLEPIGLIPGFLRFETDKTGQRFAVDVLNSDSIWCLPQVVLNESRLFVNLRYVYQGMYLMNRQQFEEFLGSGSWSPDKGHWGSRERASQGLVFEGVRRGFFSRNLVGYSMGKGIDEGALLHHTSNRYVNDPTSRFAKLALSRVLSEKKPTIRQRIEKVTDSVRIDRNSLRARPRLFLY